MLNGLDKPCLFRGEADGRLVLKSLAVGGVDTDAVAPRGDHGTGRVLCFVDKQGRPRGCPVAVGGKGAV
ncbi:MAG TPA: hypothetical protein EYP63_05085 [Desulfotomaculum sp.]|nr:hypothetical protein [Desulfotomaculum sp.]